MATMVILQADGHSMLVCMTCSPCSMLSIHPCASLSANVNTPASQQLISTTANPCRA